MLGLVLLDEPWRTRGEIAARAGVSPQLAARAASRMEAAGLVTIHGSGRTTIWQPTPLLADAVGGPMLPSDPSESWVQQWLRRRVSAHVRRCGGDIRQNVGADLVERRGTGPWTAWGFFGSLQGTKDRLQRCLSADAEVIELVARGGYALEKRLANRQPRHVAQKDNSHANG